MKPTKNYKIQERLGGIKRSNRGDEFDQSIIYAHMKKSQ
jgi:hypothetical protein